MHNSCRFLPKVKKFTSILVIFLILQEITELTVKHETLQRSTAAIEAQRDTMQSAIAALQAASEHVAGGIDALEAEVKGLSDEVRPCLLCFCVCFDRLF